MDMDTFFKLIEFQHDFTEASWKDIRRGLIFGTGQSATGCPNDMYWFFGIEAHQSDDM